MEDGSDIYLVLFVDDILVTSQDKSEIQNMKSLLNSEFEMKDIGFA